MSGKHLSRDELEIRMSSTFEGMPTTLVDARSPGPGCLDHGAALEAFFCLSMRGKSVLHKYK